MSTSTDSANQTSAPSPESSSHTHGDDAPKNIIVLSDGTGNAGGGANGTNVWRIRQAVESDPESAGREQIIIYEDGVGTSSLQPLAVLGLAFAAGITRDLVGLYG
jgi:uncharacterized protein (DUF2235 family)